MLAHCWLQSVGEIGSGLLLSVREFGNGLYCLILAPDEVQCAVFLCSLGVKL